MMMIECLDDEDEDDDDHDDDDDTLRIQNLLQHWMARPDSLLL